MANFTPGYIFLPNERVSPAKLHAIVEDGSLDNINQADLASGVRLVNLSTPGSSTTGDLLVGTDFLLEVFEGGAYADLFSNPVGMTLRNDDASTILQGDPVQINPGTSDGVTRITTTDSAARPFGVAAADILPAASGTIFTRGLVSVRVFGAWTRGDILVPGGVPAAYTIAATGWGYNNGIARVWDTGGTAGIVTLATAWIGK